MFANMLEGRIQTRDSATSVLVANEVLALRRVFVDPDRLQLERTREGDAAVTALPAVPTDFCQQPRGARTSVGAIATAMRSCPALLEMR